MHPLSVAECLRTEYTTTVIQEPAEITTEDFDALLRFGGFPQPFLKRQAAFSLRWQNLRMQQLVQQDIRDIHIIHDLNRLKLLMELLKQYAAQMITYSTLAKFTRASVDSIIRWLDILEAFYYCYRIKPWSKNIVRALIKEPTVFLWDWSLVKDLGARAENFIASHLLKAVHHWTDNGMGQYDLFYLRTTEKKEVDFVITRDEKPWILIEVKYSPAPLSRYLSEFQQQTGAEHAFKW